MSAAQHSLNLDKATCAHYYHCVLYDIPLHTPVADIAPHVVPQKTSDVVSTLAAAGCRIVPHQLHVYKEPLDAKFGYVSFFIHQLPTSTTAAEELHRLVLQWIELDLASQLTTAKCKVQLAQPPECYSSEPFLMAMQEKCPLLDPATNPDTKRLETFILSRVRFGSLLENASINDVHEAQRQLLSSSAASHSDKAAAGKEETEAKQQQEEQCRGRHHSCREHVWRSVGTFAMSNLSAKELVWLKKQLPSFPPLLITDNNMSTTHCDEAKLRQFFTVNLAPLITVEEQEEQ